MNKSFYLLIILLFFVISAIAINTERPPFLKVKIENKNLSVAVLQNDTDLRNKIKLRNNFSQEKITYTTETTTQKQNIKTERKIFKLDPNKKSRLQGEIITEKIKTVQNYDTDEKSIFQKDDLPEFSQDNNNTQDAENKIIEETQEKQNANLLPREETDRYGYEEISWNVWRSNFINQIVDDLGMMDMEEYPEGTWLYFSFEVDKYGLITNVKVFSPLIDKKDKVKIANMMKKYTRKKITIFPKNSKRTKTTVNGIIVLSYFASKYTTPDDFSDVENIKYKY